ncbi:hypothetical protein BEWA_036270 [Theileria equi strain WA]|uniref:Uncharacterized protein n=1 Tax=Theileria equi strain WA TaxID=1537102 RepID=L1LE17_THEEQ|nr:hypothetical protein BEWA_036270 [Theileria equi strain WA]EKX73591.1 hypothetical protein BEWA_036270 [Theileria equi strain WA]|eukprot:XP_004833043.1 hypothetical protein BEWA_036270 [Theileria equi strain WA]
MFFGIEQNDGGAQVSIGGIETVVEFWIPEEVVQEQPEPEPATEEEEDEESTEPSLGGTEENEQDEDNDSDEEDEDQEEDEEPETTEENEVKDNEPEEPNEEAPTESPEDDDWDGPVSQEQDDDPDLEPEPERRPRKSRNSTRRESNAYKSRDSNEKLPEDEDPEFHDGFWDTPDDYSERQDDTQDEPDGLVIDDEDPSEDHEDEAEEAYEDDSLKSAPETSTKSRTRSEEGTIGGLEQGHPKESEDNDLGEEDEDEAEESENSSSSPVSMDIADLDSQNYKHVDYIYDDNHIRLFLPNEGMIFAKLIDGENSIWEAKSDEKFEFAKVYLNKDGKAEVMLVTKNTPSGVERKYYTKTWTGWRESKDIGDRVPKLKVFAQQKSDYTIDLSATKGTKECTIFEAELLGITTKHFFPKPGYLAKGVKDGTRSIWEPIKHCGRHKSEEDFDGYDYCFSCIIHNKGDKELLEMIVVENDSVGKKYFEKADGKWVEIKKEDFNNKLKHMKSESEEASSHPSTTIPS